MPRRSGVAGILRFAAHLCRPVERAGLGLSLPKRRYTAARASATIARLLASMAIAGKARRAVAAIIRKDGVRRALDALWLGSIR